jgi:peptide/nickel transport system substrate-binding protein/oligopeptide transport system substrate-binding protein
MTLSVAASRALFRCAATRGIALLAICGCTEMSGTPDSDGTPAREPRYGGTFAMMLEAPGTLEPGLVDDVYEACISNQIYDGLLEFDSNLNPVPAISREWSISRNGLEYVFLLRDDVRFHNGRRVTASDFVYSFTRIFDPARNDHGLGGEYLRKIEGVAAYCKGEAPEITGIVAVNDTTLKIRLESPYGSFLSALAMDQTKVVAREEIERLGDEYSRHPIGTGPFRLERYDDDPAEPRVVLRANPDYFRGRPYLDRVVFHVPADYNIDTGAEWILAGRLSMCDMPGALQEQFAGNPQFRIIRRPELSFSFFGINVDMEPLRDVRVRRAIAHAIDRRRMMEVDPVGRIPAGGILPPGMFGYNPQGSALDYDPDLSRRLLEEAGYPGGRGLPVVVHWQADRGELGRRADRVMEECLEAVGIDLEYHYVEWDQFDRNLLARSIPSFGLTWVADVPDPDSFLASLFATTGVYNIFRYSNPVVDSVLAIGGGMRSSVGRADLYRRAERVILNDVPVIPLFHVANNYAVRTEVKGLVVNPFGLGGLALERVWIEIPIG